MRTIRSNTMHGGRWAALALAAALAACGGGGGSSSGGSSTVTVPTGSRSVAATAGSDVNAENFVARSSALVRAIGSAAGSGALAGVGSAGREQAQAVRSGATEPMWLAISRTMLQAARPTERAQTVHTETTGLCDSGSGTITWNDADDDNNLSAGDVLTMDTANCVIAGLPPASGRFSMTLEVVELDSSRLPAGMQALVSSTNFSVAGFGSMTGSGRLWAKGIDGTSPVVRMSYLDTAVTQGAETATYNYDVYSALNGTTVTYEVSGGIVIGGQTYSVELLNAFVNSPPTAGSLRMKDAAGDAVKLVAVNATSFDLEFYPASSPTAFTVVSRGLLWSNYKIN